MTEQTNTRCALCGEAEGKPYEYLLVRDTVTRTQTRRKQAAQVSHSYSLIGRYTGYLCDACRKKKKLAGVRGMLIFSLASTAFLFLGAWLTTKIGTNGFLDLVTAALLILAPICTIVGLVFLIKTLSSDFGSETLGAHRKQTDYPGDRGVVPMTPKEAKRKGVTK